MSSTQILVVARLRRGQKRKWKMSAKSRMQRLRGALDNKVRHADCILNLLLQMQPRSAVQQLSTRISVHPTNSSNCRQRSHFIGASNEGANGICNTVLQADRLSADMLAVAPTVAEHRHSDG